MEREEEIKEIDFSEFSQKSLNEGNFKTLIN